MKPIPRLDDEPAMLLRGRLSALGKARAEHMKALRDAYTALDGCMWESMEDRLKPIHSLVEGLASIALLWEETTTAADEKMLQEQEP